MSSKQLLSVNALALSNNIKQIVKYARENNVPCYVAASVIGITPNMFVSSLSELYNYDNKCYIKYKECDLTNFINLLEDGCSADYLELFKPLFKFPNESNEHIPTISVSFE